MDIAEYFKNVNAQQQINKLAKKFNNKSIVIYGAGEYFNILNSNYDLSKLNIVGICDKKFEMDKNANQTNFPTLIPSELKTYNYDVILVALLQDITICNYIESHILINTKNENKQVIPIIEPNLLYLLKVLLGIVHE